MKQAVMLMIAGATEPFNGATKYWKRGMGGGGLFGDSGRVPYPDFGKYIRHDEFQAWKIAFPRMWADERNWYRDFGEVTWDFLSPSLRLGMKKMLLFWTSRVSR